MGQAAQHIRSTGAHRDLQHFDFILLTESRRKSFQLEHAGLFPGPFFFHQPRQPGFNGSGLTILVKAKWQGMVSLWKPGNDPSTQCLWVRCKKDMCGGDKDLFIAACYVPPEGSKQLRHGKALEDRFDSLLELVSTASSMGHVLLGGDFNAKLGVLSEMDEDGPGGHVRSRLPFESTANRAGHLANGAVLSC